MPADYQSTARALALSTSPPEHLPHSPGHEGQSPLWSRSRRRDSSWSTTSQATTARDQLIDKGKALYRQALERWERMTLWQKIGFYAAALLVGALGIAFLILTGKLFLWLGPVAEKWERSPLAAFVLWLCVFFVSFPPLVGWSTFGTVAGFIFGIWKG